MLGIALVQMRQREGWPRAIPQQTLDNGLMTPTLKLKRPAIEERFAGQLRLLYGEHAR